MVKYKDHKCFWTRQLCNSVCGLSIYLHHQLEESSLSKFARTSFLPKWSGFISQSAFWTIWSNGFAKVLKFFAVQFTHWIVCNGFSDWNSNGIFTKREMVRWIFTIHCGKQWKWFQCNLQIQNCPSNTKFKIRKATDLSYFSCKQPE